MRLLLALLLLAPTAQDDPPKKQPKGLAGVGLKGQDVNRAIDRGVAYLREYYKERELSPHGEGIVAMLAWLHADAHKKYPDVHEKIRAALAVADPNVIGTYELGFLAMICESLGQPEFMPLLAQTIQRLLDGQGATGAWGYGGDIADTKRPELKEERKPRLRVTGVRKPHSPPGERMRKSKDAQGEDRDDISVAQYAILGLLSAHRAGLSIDPEVFRKALEYYRKAQNEDAGWGYSSQSSSYGSMTCAGIASTAICGYVLGEKEWKRDPAIKKGLAWLAKNFEVAKNPQKPDKFPLYYLYSVERVGRILDDEFIGDHEWYPLGARHLVDSQKADGSWDGLLDYSDVVATGFALLFLTRATPTLEVKVRKDGKGWLATAATTGSSAYHVILDCSGSMQRKMGGKTMFEVAKDAVCAIVEAMPAGAKMGLRVYGHHRITREDQADFDTEMLIPPGVLDKAAYAARVRKLDCFGRTPLTLSLKETVKDLEPLRKDRVTVILLTDGGESTRGADPVAAAAELVKERPNAVVHVVAFGINDSRERKQCDQIAQSGRGRCFAANKAEELLEQLRGVTASKIPYELADKDGKKIADGVFGDKRELSEGAYRIRCVIRGEKIDDEIWIAGGETTTVTADLTDERPSEKREAPKPKAGLELTVGEKKVSLAEFVCSFTPAGEEEGDGTVSFDGALTASFNTKARRPEQLKGMEFTLGDATLKLDADTSLAAKEGTIRIATVEGGWVTGTLSGTFTADEKEVRVKGTFRAELRKN